MLWLLLSLGVWWCCLMSISGAGPLETLPRIAVTRPARTPPMGHLELIIVWCQEMSGTWGGSGAWRPGHVVSGHHHSCIIRPDIGKYVWQSVRGREGIHCTIVHGAVHCDWASVTCHNNCPGSWPSPIPWYEARGWHTDGHEIHESQAYCPLSLQDKVLIWCDARVAGARPSPHTLPRQSCHWLPASVVRAAEAGNAWQTLVHWVCVAISSGQCTESSGQRHSKHGV